MGRTVLPFPREYAGVVSGEPLTSGAQTTHAHTFKAPIDPGAVSYAVAAGGGSGEPRLLYSGTKFHYLHVSHDESLGRYLAVMSALPDSPQADAFTAKVAIPAGPVELRVEVDEERMSFG